MAYLNQIRYKYDSSITTKHARINFKSNHCEFYSDFVFVLFKKSILLTDGWWEKCKDDEYQLVTI
jgi:hypothetical protein